MDIARAEKAEESQGWQRGCDKTTRIRFKSERGETSLREISGRQPGKQGIELWPSGAHDKNILGKDEFLLSDLCPLRDLYLRDDTEGPQSMSRLLAPGFSPQVPPLSVSPRKLPRKCAWSPRFL